MNLPTFHEILKPTSTNMWLLGLPIDQKCLATTRFFFFFINVLLMAIEEFMFIVSRMEAEHFLEVTALTPCLSIGILCLYKAFAVFINRKKIVRVINSLKLLYDKIIFEDLGIEEVEKYVNFVKFLTKYFFILNQVLIWVYNFIPLLLMALEWWTHGTVFLFLPFDVILPFACDTWKPWLFVYFHSIIAAVTTVVYLVAVDTLYCVLTTHVCVNFSVISYKIARLTPHNSDDIRHIVQRHQYVIELAQDLEDIFSPSLLLNFIASSIEICMLGFNIVTCDRAHLPPFLLFLTSALVQIFLLSLFGDLLITESERVGQAAYLCCWEEMDPVDKRSLIILRERIGRNEVDNSLPLDTMRTYMGAQEPEMAPAMTFAFYIGDCRARRAQRLTGMKFTPISYASFSKIISTSWSYFTILNTVYTQPSPISK